MTDLYLVIEVMVAFVDLGSSEKNYFDFLTHLIGSIFSQNFHSAPVPYQPPSINTHTHMLLITDSSMCIQGFVHINKNIFVYTSVS